MAIESEKDVLVQIADVATTLNVLAETLQNLASRVETGNREQEVRLNRIEAQAEDIHILVNNEMTMARQAELIQTRALLSTLRRVVVMNKDSRGQEMMAKDIAAIGEAERRIETLRGILADREVQQQEVETTAEKKRGSKGTVNDP